MPKWLAITVISRDVIVVIGWVQFTDNAYIKSQADETGKVAIAMQRCYAMCFDIKCGLFPDIQNVFIWLTAALTISNT